jgi:hypothetical protein
MKQTLPRAIFKEHLGQANHYLITGLVGLYFLDGSSTQTAPEELRTSWNPRDKHASISRTRIFMLNSVLGWAVDSLDMYVSLLNRKPNYLQSNTLSSNMDYAGRSVLRKVIAIGDYYKIHPAILSLVDVLITWRNNIFHDLADNSIRNESLNALKQYENYIEENFCGLNANLLPDKVKCDDNLTFKETTSLIHAAQKYVEYVDTAIIDNFDLSAFCKEAISIELNNKENSNFAVKYYGVSYERRKKFIITFFMNKYRLDDIDVHIIDACCNLKKEKDIE